jgi:hypothetical protein
LDWKKPFAVPHRKDAILKANWLLSSLRKCGRPFQMFRIVPFIWLAVTGYALPLQENGDMSNMLPAAIVSGWGFEGSTE